MVIHKVKGFGLVNKAEVDVLLEFSRFLDDPVDVGNLVSGSSAFCKTIREMQIKKKKKTYDIWLQLKEWLK